MSGKQFFCWRPFRQIEVRESGDFYPCCVGWCNYSFGNFNTDDFSEVWNGERAREFRRSILDGSYKYCNFTVCVEKANQRSMYTSDEIEKMFHEVMPPPEVIDFCHENVCNVQCVMCRDCQIGNSADKTKLLDEKIETCFLPLASNAKLVTINGQGEALYSRHCRKLIKSIAERFPNVNFSLRTNGVLVDQKNFEELGIMDRVQYIIVSLHASKKAIYDQIVKNSNFDRIIENLKWINRMREQGIMKTSLTLISVVSKLNYRDMIDFQKLSQDFNARSYFIHLWNFGTEMSGNNFNDMAVFEKGHPEYKEFRKIIRNKIFADPNCTLSPPFVEIRKEKDTVLERIGKMLTFKE